MKNFNFNLMVSNWALAWVVGILVTGIGLPQASGALVAEEQAPQAADSTQNAAEAARAEERGTLRDALSSSEKARDTRQAQTVVVTTQAPAAVQPQQIQQQPLTAPLLQQTVQSQPVAVQAAPAMVQTAPAVVQLTPVQQAAQPAPVAVQPAPVTALQAVEPAQAQSTQTIGDSAEATANLSQSELLRRERVRQEVRNEDALQVRLEELRLRDEKRRTDQILGVQASTGAAEASPLSMPVPLYSGQPQEQMVAAPVTDHPGQPAVTPAKADSAQAGQATPTTAPAVILAGPQQPGIAGDSAGGLSTQNGNPNDKKDSLSGVSIMPRAGVGNISGGGSYDVSGHFALGAGLSIAATDYVSFEIGYTYAEYGVSVATDNPFIYDLQSMYGTGNSSQTLTLKQNVIDAGLKVYLLDSNSRIRPFVGGGGAWSKSYLNYNSQILSYVNQFGGGMAQDYDMTQWLGYAEAGLDLKLSKNVSVDLMGKYYAVLSSSESSSINNYGFYSPGMFNNQAPEKQLAGGSLAGSGFYTIMGGATFSF